MMTLESLEVFFFKKISIFSTNVFCIVARIVFGPPVPSAFRD